MVIDLSNDGVGGLLLDPTYNKTRDLFCSSPRAVTRVPLPFQAELNLERFLNQVVAALKTVVDTLARESNRRPERVICFLSAPFYASQTRIIRRTAPEPFRVTRSLLNDLTAADLQQFIKQHPQLYAEVIKDAHQLIESKTMQIKLNRYPTRAPYDKLASEVELSHYVSIGSRRVLDRFREVIRGFVQRAPIEFHSFPFALFSIFRDHVDHHRYRLLLDIGAEVTEVLLLAGDVLWENVSFPAGRNGLIRELMTVFNTVPEEAISALRIYRRGGQHRLTGERMEAAFANFRKVWINYFRETLRSLSEEHLIPTKIMAVGDPSIVPIFFDWLKQDKYDEIVVSNRAFDTTLLSVSDLANQCGYQLGLPIDQGEHLLVGSVFYDKLLNVNQHG